MRCAGILSQLLIPIFSCSRIAIPIPVPFPVPELHRVHSHSGGISTGETGIPNARSRCTPLVHVYLIVLVVVARMPRNTVVVRCVSFQLNIIGTPTFAEFDIRHHVTDHVITLLPCTLLYYLY